MEKPEEILSDQEIDSVWGSANFGPMPRREVVNGAVLKCASGYYTGHTAKCIVQELGLVKSTKWELTKKGKEYLFAVYSGGKSI